MPRISGRSSFIPPGCASLARNVGGDAYGCAMVVSLEVVNPSGPDGPAPVEPEVLGSLSPSRAADFKNCPLLYRFRTIDRLPEQPSPAATRGTVVHAVLERLYDLPAVDRTVGAAQALVEPQWQRLLAEAPELATLFPDGVDSVETAQWLDSARDLVANYFVLEDPRRLEPAAREERVEVVIDGLRLRGYVDRLDVSPAGDIRVVDYKTGSTPREAFEGKALFQMKFYALVLWRTRGVVPRQLRLIYLADVDTLTYSPEAEELERFERTLRAIWVAIRKATEDQDFRPNPGRLCDWCDHHASCPAQGGTLPPFPLDAVADAGADRRRSEPVILSA
jgi:putative RecB family exonuclease